MGSRWQRSIGFSEIGSILVDGHIISWELISFRWFRPLSAFDMHEFAVLSGTYPILKRSVTHLWVKHSAPGPLIATSPTVSSI